MQNGPCGKDEKQGGIIMENTNKDWKINDCGYFFYTYLWQTIKGIITMITDDHFIVTDEFGHNYCVEKEDFFETEEEVELSL